MKNSWLLVGIVFAGLGLPALTHAQEPAPPAFEKSSAPTPEEATESEMFDDETGQPKLVRIQVEFVELSHEAVTKLLFLSKPKSSDATELRTQVQEMVAKNEAKVIETQMITAKSGQKAVTEAVHEFIYPTEYEQANLPSDSKDTPQKSKGVATPLPTAFETRNLGSTLEVEPTIGADDRTIDLRFVPEVVYHTGDTIWQEGKDAAGSSYKVMMPDIYAIRINTALTLITGKYTLAGLVSPKDAKGDTDMTRKVMVFVKCDVLTVK